MLGQPAHIVVALDAGGLVTVRRGRLDHVGIDGALHQDLRRAELARLALKNADELLAHHPALVFGVGDPLQGRKELFGSIHRHQFNAHPPAKGTRHLLRFILAQQTIVHKHAGELPADGLVQQGGGDRGVHPPRPKSPPARVPSPPGGGCGRSFPG